MNVREYNRAAWDRQVERGNQWTIPVSREEIVAARQGEWKLFLTPEKPVPRAWFPSLENCEALGLAASGGQQAPLLAAAGARVTVQALQSAGMKRVEWEGRDDVGLLVGSGVYFVELQAGARRFNRKLVLLK